MVVTSLSINAVNNVVLGYTNILFTRSIQEFNVVVLFEALFRKNKLM
jgi:hypothetical protein